MRGHLIHDWDSSCHNVVCANEWQVPRCDVARMWHNDSSENHHRFTNGQWSVSHSSPHGPSCDSSCDMLSVCANSSSELNWKSSEVFLSPGIRWYHESQFHNNLNSCSFKFQPVNRMWAPSWSLVPIANLACCNYVVYVAGWEDNSLDRLKSD